MLSTISVTSLGSIQPSLVIQLHFSLDSKIVSSNNSNSFVATTKKQLHVLYSSGIMCTASQIRHDWVVSTRFSPEERLLMALSFFLPLLPFDFFPLLPLLMLTFRSREAARDDVDVRAPNLSGPPGRKDAHLWRRGVLKTPPSRELRPLFRHLTDGAQTGAPEVCLPSSGEGSDDAVSEGRGERMLSGDGWCRL